MTAVSSAGNVRWATERLADWSAGLAFEAIPRRIAAIAKTCLVDTFGVALAGSAAPLSGITSSLAEKDGPCAILGTRKRGTVQAAAFANASAAHALDFDDNCYAGLVHASAVVAPAVQAIGERQGLDGRSLLAAFVAGLEVEFAVGRAMPNVLYDRGWFTTALLGAIGAAAGASRALSLSPAQTANALGYAIAATGGSRIAIGSDAKPLIAGRAAALGVEAALLAEAGMSAPRDAIEGRGGLADLLVAGPFALHHLDRLGRSWGLEDPGIDRKPYPVCLSAHAAIDALDEILAQTDTAPEDVAAIEADVPAVVAGNLRHPSPLTAQQAQFSLPFALGCRLCFGEVSLDHLSDALLANRELRSAMEKVRMTTSVRWNAGIPSLSSFPEGAFVTLLTKGGKRLEAFVGAARGTVRNPMTERQIDEKFFVCATRALSRSQADRLHGALRGIENVADCRSLFGPSPVSSRAGEPLR